MEVPFVGQDDDSGIDSSEEVKENIKKAEDLNLDSEEERVRLANYIDDQISQALITGRIEAETREGGGKDKLLMAAFVSAGASVCTALLFLYQFYL